MLLFVTISLYSLTGKPQEKIFHNQQMFDETTSAFTSLGHNCATLGKNVGEPAVKVALPFLYLYKSGIKTHAQASEDLLAAVGAYTLYEEVKYATGKKITLPHIDIQQYAKDPDKKKQAETLNACIDGAEKTIDLAMPVIIVWLLKFGCSLFD